MKTTLLSLLLTSLCALASAQTTVGDSQAKAVKKYPALGVQGSPLNTRFLQAVAERRKTTPAFFANAQWPLLLADELAGNPPPAAPPVPASVAPSQTAEVKVTVGDISRWQGIEKGKPTGGLNVPVRLSSPELAQAKGVRTTVKSATDDAGNALKKKEDHFDKDDGKFKELKKPFGSGFGNGKSADDFEVSLSFEAPDTVKSIKTLAGSIELVLPAKDPGSIIAASFAKDAGKPLKNAALAAAGVEITLQKLGGTPAGSVEIDGVALQQYSLTYQIKDPKSRVASVEFFDASGTKLKSGGDMSMGDADVKTVSASFQGMLPRDATAKIYLVTDKSVVIVPFELTDIPVPGK
jgi:hypothetical protein